MKYIEKTRNRIKDFFPESIELSDGIFSLPLKKKNCEIFTLDADQRFLHLYDFGQFIGLVFHDMENGELARVQVDDKGILLENPSITIYKNKTIDPANRWERLRMKDIDILLNSHFQI